MPARRMVLAGGLAVVAAPAFALDPGLASGLYEKDGARIELKHAVALAIDNAEGFNDTPNEIRLLLSDREIAPAALYGLAFPPVWRMAKAGIVRGLLVSFDPADRESLRATILAPPEGGYSLATNSLSNSTGLWSRLDISATRIAGELKPDASEAMRFSFSAPVFTNPVVADLKGPAAAASEPVKALVARAEAVGRGDMAAAAALSTEDAAAGIGESPPELLKAIRAEIPNMVRQLKAAKRVVIRAQTAAVMVVPGEWASVTLVGGQWKVAD